MRDGRTYVRTYGRTEWNQYTPPPSTTSLYNDTWCDLWKWVNVFLRSSLVLRRLKISNLNGDECRMEGCGAESNNTKCFTWSLELRTIKQFITKVIHRIIDSYSISIPLSILEINHLIFHHWMDICCIAKSIQIFLHGTPFTNMDLL